MRILSCTISKPGLLDSRRIEPSEGITVIYGRSDSGKTTIARALLEMLDAGMNGGLLNRTAWANLFVELTLAGTGARFRLTRNSERTYEIAAIDDDGDAREMIREDLANRDPDTVRRSVTEKLRAGANGHRLITALAANSTPYLTTLAYLPSPVDAAIGSSLDYGSIRRLLLDDASRFFGLHESLSAVFGGDATPAAPGGIVEEMRLAESQMRELEKQVQLIDIQQSKYEKLHREKALIQKEIDGLERAASGLRDRVSALGRVRELIVRKTGAADDAAAVRAELEADADGHDAAERLSGEITGSFPQFVNFDETKKRNLAQIQERYTEIRDLNEEIGAQRERMAAWAGRLKNLSISLIAASFAATLLAYNRIIITIAPPKVFALGVVLGSLSALSLAGFAVITLFGRRTNAMKKLALRKAEAEGRLQQILNENNLSIRDLKLESLYEYLLQYFNDFNNFTEKQLELFRIRESLMAPAEVRDREARLERLLAEEGELAAQIDATIRDAGQPADAPASGDALHEAIAAIAAEIGELEAAIETKRGVMRQVAEELLTQEDRGVERETLVTAIDAIRQTHARRSDHARVMRFIGEVLTSAVRQREEKQLARLVARAADTFHALTDNQYVVSIDREHVRAIIAGTMQPADANQVVTHLLLIAVKIALTEFMIDADATPPLILDEPFLYMDDRRSARFREILKATAPARQLILFTHNNQYKDWGTYIEL